MDTALFDLFVDSLWQILLPGLTVTIPLTAIAFSGALVIAVVVALIQYAHVPVLKDLARFYIWVTRGTPLLVQLFVVFYGLPHAGVLINLARRRKDQRDLQSAPRRSADQSVRGRSGRLCC